MSANILPNNTENFGVAAVEAGDLPEPFNTVADTTAKMANVDSSTSSVTVLSGGEDRNTAIFYNDSSEICYLAFAAEASTTAYTVQIPAQSSFTTNSYSGPVSAIWTTANGALRVTSF